MRHNGAGRLLVLGVLVLSLTSAGCQSLTLPYPFGNEPEPENPLADWSGQLREPTSPGYGSALDVRSRQIERNLGVR